MKTIESILAETRSRSGAGNARSLRRNGKVPGVIYGDKKDPQLISVDYKTLAEKCQRSSFYSQVIDLSLEGKPQPVIVKEVQLDPVRDVPIHVDFQRVGKDSKIHVSVSLVFINEDKSPGLKRGGALNVILHSLEIICPPHFIPEKIVVDLAGLEMGTSLTLDALTLPEDVKAAHPERDCVLATIVAPSGESAKTETVE